MNLHTHVFIVMYRHLVLEVFDVQPRELVTLSADDIILNHIEIGRYAVSVVMSLTVLTKLPLAGIFTLFVSSFSGQKSTNTRLLLNAQTLLI